MREVDGAKPQKTRAGLSELIESAPPVHQDVLAAQTRDALQVLFAFRLINALCTRTFFQPDEYFQALEPAWQWAFGDGSGAWLTWVSQLGLRA